MIYIRGHSQDFTSWGKGWDYNALIPYFEKQEKYLNISDHGKVDDNKWYEIISEAWKELNLPTHQNQNQNYEALIGTKRVKLMIEKGKRFNTAKVYLQRASKQLHVIKNSYVEKIIFDSVEEKAIGVKIRKDSGHIFDVMVSKEIIISAGSIATPQLLMLSGIGPKSHLEEKDIPCVLNLPVGQNLQDHLIVPIFLKTKEISPPSHAMSFLLQYMLNRSGHLSSIGITDFVGFINTDNSSKQPNIQFHHMFYPKNNNISLKGYLAGVGYKREIIDNVIDLNKQYDLLGIYPTLLHPKSKGKINLRNKIPASNPIIQSNYLDDPNDVETLIKAIKFIHKLENTDIFKSLGIEIKDVNIKGCSNHVYDTDSYWDCYIRHMGMTIYHPVGTVKMGDDENSVVDFNLLVRGLKNLRVVDASVMPNIPGANVMAATLAIAQKAVDIIKLKHSLKDEL